MRRKTQRLSRVKHLKLLVYLRWLQLSENRGQLALLGTLAGGFVLPVSIPALSYMLGKR